MELGRGRRWTAAATAVAAALLAAPAAQAGHADLLGHWPLDTVTSTAGGTTPDVSGHGFTGTDVRGGLLGGRFGNALALTGDGHGMDVADDPVLRPHHLTLMAWVRRDGASPPGRTIVAKGASSSCSTQTIALDTGSTPGALRFTVRIYSQEPSNVAVLTAEVPSAPIWDGRWHAIAGTYGSSMEKGVQLYVDGKEVASDPHPNGGYAWRGPFYQATPDRRLTVGRYGHSGCDQSAHQFTGDVDDVRLYGRALSAADIAAVQPAEAGEPGEPAPPPPPPEPPPRGGAGGSAAPEITELRPSPAPGSQGAMLVTARIDGQYDRLEWRMGGSRTPAIIGRTGQDTLRLRPARTGTLVTAQAIGLGGASPEISLRVPRAPRRLGRVGRRIEGIVGRRPVFGVGSLVQLSGQGLQFNCSVAANKVRVAALDGLLDVEGGCLTPIGRLADIPQAERGVFVKMARQYGIALDESNVDLALGLSDAYVSRGDVRINGVDFDPGSGAAVVVFPQARLLASSDARMSVGKLILDNARRFEIDTRVRLGRMAFGLFRVAGGNALMRGFEMFGDVKVSAARGDFGDGRGVGARISGNVRLPPFLRLGGGSALAFLSMRASTDRGLILDALRVGPLELSIGPVGVRRFQIDYDGPNDQWDGQGVACLPTGSPCLDMAPPNGGVRIIRGELEFAGASLGFTPPLTLFPGIDMDRLGFGFGLGPTRFLANTKLVALRLLTIDGRLVVAFPTAGEPYTLERDVSWLEPNAPARRFPGHLYGQRRTTFTVAASAAASLRVPAIGDVPFGNAYFLYEYPGYIVFGGRMDRDILGVARFEGGVTGEMNAGNGRFDFHGDTRGCVGPLCYGGDVHVSSRGASACLRPPVIPDFGIGVYWPGRVPQDWHLQGPGCRWSPYRQLDIRGRARAAQAGTSFTVDVARGAPGKSIRLISESGAPRVRVTGPDGAVLESPEGDGPVARGELMVVRFEALKSTLVGLGDTAPGAYRIEILDGPPVTGAFEATEQPPARVAAVVRGNGARRVLTYDIGRRAAQRVRFLEVTASGSAREIGTVAGGGRGNLRFSPAPGDGQRTVVAQFELAGLAAERVTAARFSPPSPRLARPRRLRVRRAGARLRVRWARVAGAGVYELVVSPTGDARQRRVRTRRRSVTIARVPRSSSGRVTVRALARLRQGSPSTARFRATARRPTRLRRLPRPPRL